MTHTPATCRPAARLLRSAFALLSVALALGGWSRPAAAQSQAFGPAETLKFSCRYLGLTAGSMSVTVGSEATVEGKSVWPLIATARTESFFSLYPIKAKFISWWVPAEGRSLGSDFDSEERGKRRRERIRYAPEASSATTTREKPGAGTKVKTYATDPTAQDLLGAVFRLRGLPVAVGTTTELPVFTGGKTFILKVKALRTEKVKAAGRSYDTVVASVSMDFGGGLASTRETLLWLTNDEAHIPVKIDAEFAIGSFVAELVSYQKGMAPVVPSSTAHAVE